MPELTVAIVAAIIAACITLVHQILPLFLAILLSSALGLTNTAASWSAAAAAFQQCKWPFLLRSDSARSRGVSWSILIVTWMFAISTIAIAVASVVTPLGLYSVAVSGKQVRASFEYIADSSPFGYGTPPRSNLSFTRICERQLYPLPCPSTDSIRIDSESNGIQTINLPYGYDINVPASLLGEFPSNVTSTISNAFDIQYRRYTIKKSSDYNNGSQYLAGSTTNMRSLVLDNRILAVEGLVVDAEAGGILFRNHTAPSGFQYGITWDEDLLSIEPETVCVDTNLTLDYSIANENASATAGVFLTDRGGFANLNWTYPLEDYGHNQEQADLYGRAYQSAWLHNVYTALYLNITDLRNSSSVPHKYMTSFVGKSFQVGSNSTINPYTDGMVLHTFDGYLASMSSLSGSGFNAPSNPWNIQNVNWTLITGLCTRQLWGDFPGIDSIITGCGLMRSVPHRVDQGSSLIFETGSRWSQKLYTCVTAAKASIKVVSLNYTQGEDLSGLSVQQVRAKTYDSPSDEPTWGVENTGEAYHVGEIQPLWGLVDDSSASNLSTLRRPWFYLPGYFAFDTLFDSFFIASRQNLPATDFPGRALGVAYHVGGPSSPAGGIDYTGHSSLAMFARWQELSANASAASLIPNLIFTDAAANMVVGTKGANASQRAFLDNLITPTQMTVRYHFEYAIPAFLCLLVLLVAIALVTVMACFRKATFAMLKRQLNATSPGRLYTASLFPNRAILPMSSSSWSREHGKGCIDVSGDLPVAVDAADEQLFSHRNDARPEMAAAKEPLVANMAMAGDER